MSVAEVVVFAGTRYVGRYRAEPMMILKIRPRNVMSCLKTLVINPN